MEKINLSAFYDHQRFLKDVRAGEKLITKSEKELKAVKNETTTFKVGDLVVSTGYGTYKEGVSGKIVEIAHNGPFLSIKVEWEFSSKKKPCYTFERLNDIRLI